jgi:hypothetical protein
MSHEWDTAEGSVGSPSKSASDDKLGRPLTAYSASEGTKCNLLTCVGFIVRRRIQHIWVELQKGWLCSIGLHQQRWLRCSPGLHHRWQCVFCMSQDSQTDITIKNNWHADCDSIGLFRSAPDGFSTPIETCRETH